MAKTSALSSGGETIHTRTTSDSIESQVAVIGKDGSDSVVQVQAPSSDTISGADSNLGVNTFGLIYDSSADSWQRARTPVADSLARTGVQGVTVQAFNGSTYDRVRGDTSNGLDVDVTRLPAPLTVTGGGTEASALRVTVANNSTGVVSVDDDGGSLTVDSPGIPSALGSHGGLVIEGVGSGVAVPVSVNTSSGGGTEATAARVTIASNSTGVLAVTDNGGNLSIDDGGNSITVDGTVAVSTLPALVAGTANIGDVDVLTLPGSLTGKAEDTASSPADVGIPNLGVRNDTPSVLTDTDGDYTMVATDKYGRTQVAPVRSLPKSIQVSGSIGITTAAVWNDKAVWAVPASTLFAPKMARCAVTTASTRTLVLAGKQLATFNPGTNTFTATGSVSSPDFYDRMFYRVATTHSATADTMTATYVDQDGNAGNTTSGLVIASAAAGGSWFEFILATNDFGVRSVSAVSDTAAPTSVVDEIWGFRTLLEDLGTAITPHIAYLGEGLQVPNGESIVILFNAAATTAQQRFASVLGDLVAA